ncbi:hypothetical protein AYI68_g7678, partial [Smittium mucronatum]
MTARNLSHPAYMKQ